MKLSMNKIIGAVIIFSLARAPVTWAQNGLPGKNANENGRPNQQIEVGKFGPGAGRGKFRDQIRKELDLRPDQEKVLNGLNESRQQHQELKGAVRRQREELNEALRSGMFAEDEVLERVRRLNESNAQLNTSRVQNIITLKKTLTPEQFSKLRQMMEQHRQRRVERFRNMRGGEFGSQESNQMQLDPQHGPQHGPEGPGMGTNGSGERQRRGGGWW